MQSGITRKPRSELIAETANGIIKSRSEEIEQMLEYIALDKLKLIYKFASKLIMRHGVIP